MINEVLNRLKMDCPAQVWIARISPLHIKPILLLFLHCLGPDGPNPHLSNQPNPSTRLLCTDTARCRGSWGAHLSLHPAQVAEDFARKHSTVRSGAVACEVVARPGCGAASSRMCALSSPLPDLAPYQTSFSNRNFDLKFFFSRT